MGTHTEYVEGYENRCECGLFHSSLPRAIACEMCIEVLTSDEHGVRRIHDAVSGETVWETPLAILLQKLDDERVAREMAEDDTEARAAVSPGRLTFSPFAGKL